MTDCAGKKRYTRLGAKLDARIMRRKDMQVMAYACRECGRWHVGGIGLGYATKRPAPRVVCLGVGSVTA
ncbi:hypothetical protein [Acetobacter aceti]|uniref:hypothetical protein n=1 Tax=Acetobacter aceti TaxID=435 RepID=UPI0011AF294D|nr:hypothetical protein [Acetobacter aceti]